MSDAYFQQQLASIKARGLLRDLAVIPQPAPTESGAFINFSSNDYLGLAQDERLKMAGSRAVELYGCGATASRMMAGHLKLAEELEADLAIMMGTEAALVFGSGFLTNVGVLSSIAEEGDEVFSDELNHASIIDGIRLSRVRCSIYRHKDMGVLEGLLIKSDCKGKKIIVSESVFSMDGDVAPVKVLNQLAQRYGALLMIDEAHAIGVMGERGGGVCRLEENAVCPDIVVGTLSKALGGYGGFAACSKVARSFLMNRARTFIYSTGLPPGCLATARAAVSIVTSSPEMGKSLLEKACRFHALLADNGLNVLPFESHILPVMVGSNEKAVAFAEMLNRQGLLVRAIRPPTVPAGTSRIRLSVTLSISDQALEKAAGVIADVGKQVVVLK